MIGFAPKALICHTGAAITAVIGVVLILSNLAALLPDTVGTHTGAHLPRMPEG